MSKLVNVLKGVSPTLTNYGLWAWLKQWAADQLKKVVSLVKSRGDAEGSHAWVCVVVKACYITGPVARVTRLRHTATVLVSDACCFGAQRRAGREEVVAFAAAKHTRSE